MNKISGVYLIRNTITNDCYVGSSVDIKRRWADHKSLSTWKKCPNNLMYIDFQKYRLSNFTFEILEKCDKSQLFIREQYFIKKLKPTYNTNRAFRTEEEFIEQQREDAKKWYQAHKEKVKEAIKQWQQIHKEHCREYHKQYYHKRKAEKLS